MSLKKCVFGCEAKITLFNIPKQPIVTWIVDAVCFSGQQWEFLKCVCWRTFYKPGPVRCWICASFDTERWSSPSYKRSRSWFRTADGKWNSIQYLFCWRSALKCSSLISSAHGVPPGARLFSEKIVKLYFSFINIIKLKTFCRYEGCNTIL